MIELLAVWAVLIAAVVAYVLYRVLSDKADGSAPHPQYPLVSKATDRMFPPKGAWLQWTAYIALLIGVSGFTILVFSGKDPREIPPLVFQIIALSILIGGSVLVATKLRRKEK
jgi:hypothetical protein